jgi:hypothetical protein
LMSYAMHTWPANRIHGFTAFLVIVLNDIR